MNRKIVDLAADHVYTGLETLHLEKGISLRVIPTMTFQSDTFSCMY